MTDDGSVTDLKPNGPVVSETGELTVTKSVSDQSSWELTGMAKELEEKLEEDFKDPTLSITELVNDRLKKESPYGGSETPVKDTSVYDFYEDDDDVLSGRSLSCQSTKLKKPANRNSHSKMPAFKPLKSKSVAIDPRIISLDTTRDLYKEGHLVWGKVRGYSYWPGVVTVDPFDGLTVKFIDGKPKVSDVPHSHVHFLAYDNQRAWLPESAMLPYEGREKFQELADQVPANSVRRKDYCPTTKSLRDRFKKAIEVAESVYGLGLRQRLDKLGFVYVPVKRRRYRSRSSEFSNGHKMLVRNNSRGSEVASPKPRKRSESQCKRRSKTVPSPKASTDVKLDSSSVSKHSIAAVGNSNADLAEQEASQSRSVVNSSRKSETSRGVVLAVSSPVNEAEIRDISKVGGGGGGTFDEFDSDPDDTSDEPKLGSLVWGWMNGFPYWPCFITKNPNSGKYKRESAGAKKRCDYHAQFFNWNNESGWVSKTLPWCAMEQFQAKGKEATSGLPPNHPEWKAWSPSGRMAVKWNLAFHEANKTANMTRKERHHLHVVFYRSEEESKKTSLLIKNGPHRKRGRPKGSFKTPKGGRKRKVSKDQSVVTEPETDDDVVSSSIAKKFKMQSRSKKPGPLSLKNATARLAQQRKFDLDNALKRKEEEESMKLPPGWEARVYYNSDGQRAFKYCSSNGDVFYSLIDAIAELLKSNGVVGSRSGGRKRSFSTSCLDARTVGGRFQVDDGKGWLLVSGDSARYPPKKLECTEAGILEGGVEYYTDETLPDPWVIKKSKRPEPKRARRRCRKRKSSAPKFLRSKINVTGTGHPAAELETLLVNYLPIIPSSAPAQLNDLLFDYEWTKLACSRRAGGGTSNLTINLLEWSVDDAKRHPILSRAVAQCYVDMVHLPDVFLKHPSVKVVESENELVISDLYTNDFIAKKIFYE